MCFFVCFFSRCCHMSKCLRRRIPQPAVPSLSVSALDIRLPNTICHHRQISAPAPDSRKRQYMPWQSRYSSLLYCLFELYSSPCVMSPSTHPLFRDPCPPFLLFVCLLLPFWTGLPVMRVPMCRLLLCLLTRRGSFNLTPCDSCFWVIALCYLHMVIRGKGWKINCGGETAATWHRLAF